MIVPNAVRLVGFRASVLGPGSISQDCHCIILLAGGIHWHLQAPRLSTIEVPVFWDYGLPHLRVLGSCWITVFG